MVPFTIRNLSKREKGYSAAITACWGHPILANPKEPLNVSFSFFYFFFLEFEKEPEELTCVVWESLRHVASFAFHGTFGSLSSSTQAASAARGPAITLLWKNFLMLAIVCRLR